MTLGAVSVGAAHKHSVCQVVLSPSNCSEGMRATGIEQYVMVVLTCLLDSGERRGGRREGGRGGREGRKGGRGGREEGREGGREEGREGEREEGREGEREEQDRRGKGMCNYQSMIRGLVSICRQI